MQQPRERAQQAMSMLDGHEDPATDRPSQALFLACEIYMPTSSVTNGTLPRIIFIEELSLIIGKTPTTIRTCATCLKYGHLIPRPFKLPYSRRLCWYESDVLKWIESSQPAFPPPLRRPRGRPTKSEQLARQRWIEADSK